MKRTMISLIIIILSLFFIDVIYATDSCGNLLINGEPPKNINFVFVAEEYSDKEAFLNDVKSFIGLDNEGQFTLLNYIPYSEFRDNYNFYYYFVENADYECADSATAVPNDQRFCFNLDVAFDELSSVCGEYIWDADFIFIISNKGYRSSADAYTLEEIDPKTRIIRLSLDLSETPPEKRESVLDDFKKIVLHEFGHSLGSLSDEYIELAKDQYKPISPIGAANIDVEGCPKWCSGELNQDALYFQDYLDYKECIKNLNVNDLNDNPLFMACWEEVAKMKEGRAFNQDFGIGCEYGSGCFWGAGGMNGFRSMECSLMTTHMCTELGSVNERIAREGLQELVNSRKLDINKIKFEIVNVSLMKIEILDDNLMKIYTFEIEFDLKNQDDEPFILKINKHNYDLYSSINSARNLVFRNLLNNNYHTLYEHTVSSKDRPQLNINSEDKVNITFIAIHNNARLNETYELNLYDLSFNKKGEDIETNLIEDGGEENGDIDKTTEETTESFPYLLTATIILGLILIFLIIVLVMKGKPQYEEQF